VEIYLLLGLRFQAQLLYFLSHELALGNPKVRLPPFDLAPPTREVRMMKSIILLSRLGKQDLYNMPKGVNFFLVLNLVY